MALVPAGYTQIVFLDIDAIGQSPLLQQAISLEELGLPAGFEAALGALLDTALVAVPDGGPGRVLALDGPIDVNGLLNVAGSLGIRVAPGAEVHRRYQIRSGDAFGVITLSIAAVNDVTTVMSQGTTLQGATTASLLKSALDAFDGVAPRLQDEPNVALLLKNAPLGFATALRRDCTNFDTIASMVGVQGLVPPPGCTGLVATLELATQDTVVVNALVGLADERQAAVALQLLEAAVKRGVPSPLKEVTLGREGTLVRARATASAAEVLRVIAPSILP
jgi:hypothetical protein